MWVLFIVFLSVQGNINVNTDLGFRSFEDCQTYGKKIEAEVNLKYNITLPTSIETLSICVKQ